MNRQLSTHDTRRARLSPRDTRSPRRWTREELEARGGWRLEAPAALVAELDALERWSHTVSEPVEVFELDHVDVPATRSLARQLRRELDEGSGVVWIRRLPAATEMARRLLFTALGLCLGRPVGDYGRLHDVRDTGRSYRSEAIPVSQTRDSTGVHTDSSRRAVCPRYIGLLCIRPAAVGGESRLTSALQAHEVLRRTAPEALELLYGDFVRDVVTPGADRGSEALRANSFPIFSAPPGPAFRYMRYWIERGQQLVEQPLDSRTLDAFDRLDAALEHPEHVVRFRLQAGDMMFCDNTRVAHDRDAYESDPEHPRLLCRLWIDPDQRHAPA
jgi:alpha-ketoglutarate-dependent taurine dioxygenase